MRRNLLFLFMWLSSFPSQAAPSREEIAWKYPCDLYYSNACSHLPPGTSSHYFVPSDFGIHVLRHGENGEEVLRVYVGDHPSASIRTRIASFSEGARNVEVHADMSNGELQVDVYIRSSRGDGTTHIFGSMTPESSVQFREFMSGLRMCFPNKNGLSCPATPRLGKGILKAIDLYSIKEMKSR